MRGRVRIEHPLNGIYFIVQIYMRVVISFYARPLPVSFSKFSFESENLYRRDVYRSNQLFRTTADTFWRHKATQPIKFVPHLHAFQFNKSPSCHINNLHQRIQTLANFSNHSRQFENRVNEGCNIAVQRRLNLSHF
jgi:hypothetical protein